jgi:predicted RNA-binding protein with TRAM domain
MSTFSSKVVAYGVIGSGEGVTASKIVAYVVMAPGTESGVTPPDHRPFTYAQRIPKQEP